MTKSFYYLMVFMFLPFLLIAQRIEEVPGDMDRKIQENEMLLETDPRQALLNVIKLKEAAIKAKNHEVAIKSITQLVKILVLNKADYNRALEELKLGDSLLKGSKDYNAMIEFCMYRGGVYSQLGLPDVAYQVLQEALLLTDKLADGDQKNIALARIYCNMSIFYAFKQDDKNELIYINKGQASLSKVNDHSGWIDKKIGVQATLYHVRAGLYFSQHQVDSARYYYLKAYGLFTNGQYPVPLFSKLDILKSMSHFFYQQKDYRSAIHFAKTGLSLTEDTNHNPLISTAFYDVLYKSYLEINQADSSKFYSDLLTESSQAISTAIESGINTSFKERSEQDRSKYSDQVRAIIFIGLGTVLVLVGGSVYMIRRGRRRIHQKYEALITKLGNQEAVQQLSTTQDAPSEVLHPDRENFYIPDETLAVLLKKLENFEKSNKFIEKNVTLSSMAHNLNSNARYISEIIKEYRGKNFNNYINGLRVEFITKLLYNDPQYRKYKIAYLASYAGFSSGVVFTNIFKKETGMTPSYFINQLAKEKQFE